MIRPNETILDKAHGAWKRPFFLLHVLEGIEIAGSGTRLQNECFRVMSLDRDGTRHSKAFKTLEEARVDFERWTTPIVAIGVN